METVNTTTLESTLSYCFKNRDLLIEALSHSSFVNEQPLKNLRDNERLEFLGDAVLNLVIGHVLMDRFPEINEGNLSRLRAQIVNESQLASIAREIELGAFIQLGKGENQTNGREKNSILANTLEALIAAVYLDGGFYAAFDFIVAQFETPLNIEAASSLNGDYKSRLQELVQVTSTHIPQYQIIEESGPDHDKTFHTRLCVGAIQTEGVGKSKKLAEQDAARKGLALLQEEGHKL
jgi:ribonuclease III